MKLPKFANWFKNTDLENTDPEKNQQPTPPEAQPDRRELQKSSLEIEKLSNRLKQAQKQIAQLEAQLQISQGFRVELGETQAKLQIVEAEAQRYKKELFERQKQLNAAQSQLTKVQQTLTKFQNWEQQLETPIQVTDISKTLPKQDFETLWGFGIISPQAEFTITTGAILVKGWVLGKKSNAETLKVVYSGKTLLETPVHLRRPIVTQRYPDIPTANQSGFEFSLSVAGISTTTTLNLLAVLADQTAVNLCDITLNLLTNESKDTQSSI